MAGSPLVQFGGTWQLPISLLVYVCTVVSGSNSNIPNMATWTHRAHGLKTQSRE